MTSWHIHFAGDVPFLAAFGLLAAGLTVVVLAYRWSRDRLSAGRLALLTGLRLALIALLIGALVQPVLSYRVVPAEDAPVLLLVDTSQSMSMTDTPGGLSRLESAAVPWAESGIARQLERRFTVQYYAFDAATARLDSVEAMAERPPAGEMTLLAESFASAHAQSGADTITGVVVLTDGAHQSAEDPVEVVRRIGAPVWPVAVGSVSSTYAGKPDVSIRDVSGERRMTLGAENQFVLRLEQQGCTGETVQLEVSDDGRTVASDTLVLTDDRMDASVRLVPEEPGKRVFKIKVAPLPQEEVIENNEREFTAIVSEDRLHVLCIEGTPRWEYKFLKRALEWDPGTAFTGFVQGKEGLFLRQGEPVASGALPATREEFEPFDVVVLGDIGANALTSQQLQALRGLVFEDGKGLVWIPGGRAREPMGEGPLAPVLPARLAGAGTTESVNTPFTPSLTPEGRAHPLFAGLREDLVALSGVDLPGCMALTGLSPGATVLAEHPTARADGRAAPLIVAHQAGRGRALVFAFDSTWRWHMESGGGERSLHGRLWGQAVRWAAGEKDEFEDGPLFIAYTDKDHYELGQTVTLYGRLRSEDARGIDARVAADVTRPDGSRLTVPLEFVAGSGGIYRAGLTVDAPGEYNAGVIAQTDGEMLAQDTARFFMGRPLQEFDRIAMDETLLRRLAFESGGGFHTPETAAAIPGEITQTAVERAVYEEKRLGRSAGAFFLIIVCASLEWFLRKRHGLM